MIKVSDLAKEKSISIDDRKKKASTQKPTILGVGVKSGGCSGLEYVLKFDNEKTEADQVLKTMG